MRHTSAIRNTDSQRELRNTAAKVPRDVQAGQTIVVTRNGYEAVPDADARKHGQVRVIDESGEDYLYPEDHFAPIKLPEIDKFA